MKTATVAWSCFGAFVVVMGCTNDYDSFRIGHGAGGGKADASVGGRTPDGSLTGGSGGVTGAGGSTGGATGGTGGVLANADASVDSEPPEASTGGSAAVDAAADVAQGCPGGEKRCDSVCVSTADPATRCAEPGCGPCTVPNAVAKCLGGSCAIDRCESGFDDCNDLEPDGCEQDLLGSAVHCGACRRACATAGVASVQCGGGVCTSTCQPGLGNCNRPTSGNDDGCEQDVQDDARNCGGCGNDCTAQNGLICRAGVCGCDSDLDCRAGGPPGGTCDMGSGRCVCGAETCNAGEVCRFNLCRCNSTNASCAAGETCCQTPSGCFDLTSNRDNCGACGHACPPAFVCVSGACVCNADADCSAGSTGVCTAGSCSCGGTACADGQRCLSDHTCG